METVLLTADRAGVRLDVFLTERLDRAVSRSAAQKLLESGEYLSRNAYEVSCFTLEAADAEPAPAPSDVLGENRYVFEPAGRKHMS